jgi:hypothetical protein
MKQSVFRNGLALWCAGLMWSCAPAEDRLVETPTGKRIETPAELAKIGAAEEYPLDGEYYLANDLDLSGSAPWNPIGQYEEPDPSDETKTIPAYRAFTGRFNGDGKTIRGLVLGDSSGTYTGLFGVVEDHGYIEHLVIELGNTSETPVELTSGTQHYLGVLAGYAKAARVSDVTVRGTLCAETPGNAGQVIGGLIGRAEGSRIMNVSAELDDLQAWHTGTAATAQQVGGVIGYADGGCLLTGLSAAGAITAGTNGRQYVGGIVSYMTGTGTVLDGCSGTVSSIRVKYPSNRSSVVSGGVGTSINGAVYYNLPDESATEIASETVDAVSSATPRN